MDQQNNYKEDNELMYIYEWVDSVPLSRPKKNIARDFSDGVLMAEMVKYHIPKIVELHNYPAASSTTQKNYNWATLNRFQISKKEIQDIIACKPNVIENLLKKVYKYIQKHTANEENNENKNNQSGENDNYDNSNNENLNVNKTNPLLNDKNINYDSITDPRVKKMLDEKDMRIEELKNIIDILEMKLKNSGDIQAALEKRVKELTDIIREKGLK